MKFIDTHTHLYLPEFDADRDEMIGRAAECGVSKLLMPNIDSQSLDSMLSVSDKYKNICYPMIGLHPTSVQNDDNSFLESFERILRDHSFVAIGEIGIDLYWDRTHLKEQTEVFRRQIRLAIETELPAVIHSREAIPEIISVLEEFRGEELKGVFHAFSGTADDAKKITGMGFVLGIGGTITFKNSKLNEIIPVAGIENIILETDSPYLAPVPYRGRRNESSYIPLINKKLAEILNMDEDSTASVTFDNSCRLFNISD